MPREWLKRKTALSDPSREPLSRFGLWLIISGLLAVIALGSWVAARTAGHSAGLQAQAQANRAVQAQVAIQLSKGCDRTQILRGYLLLRARQSPTQAAAMAPHLFGLVWCSRTFAPGYKGSTVYLPPLAAECFLKLESEGYWNDREAFTDPARLRSTCANN